VAESYLCQFTGSPLVLDLAGNGIQATSPEEGVAFDLLGLGQMKTAWIKNDDALLVWDRNGNGRIDNGTELFGSAFDMGGVPASDGFKALSTLDRTGQGGNGNGQVDPQDQMYPQLKAWQDQNHDGISQAVELITLSDLGIQRIHYSAIQILPHAQDAAGNSLSMQGSFDWADGRQGSVVDVFFKYQSH
jgi:hypothetical protein